MRIVQRPREDFLPDPRGTVVRKDTPPPPKTPQQVRGAGSPAVTRSLIGERVMIAAKRTWTIDVRALSEPYDAEGTWMIDVCDEADWYAAGQDAAAVPLTKRTSVRAREVWTD